MALTASLTSGSDIQWSNGELFNGYVLLLMALPNVSGAVWSKVALKEARWRVPTRIKVLIKDGRYEDTHIWRTDSLVPPLVKYSAFFYDTTDRLIALGSALFSVAVDTYTLNPPTLTVPTAAAVSPGPDTVYQGTTVVPALVPYQEALSGTKNGTNLVFTISREPGAGGFLWVLRGGVVQDEGVHFTRTGTTITMTTPPESWESLRGVIYG